jgi:hypothetical protein
LTYKKTLVTVAAMATPFSDMVESAFRVGCFRAEYPSVGILTIETDADVAP